MCCVQKYCNRHKHKVMYTVITYLHDCVTRGESRHVCDDVSQVLVWQHFDHSCTRVQGTHWSCVFPDYR